jgi:hypothetical protein
MSHWTCSVGAAGGCVDDPVPVNQTFHVNQVIVYSFDFATPRGLLGRGHGTAQRVVEEASERLGHVKCEYCGGPALWQGGEARPVRQVADLTGEVLHLGNRADLFVQFRGAYLPDELFKEFHSAGWRRPEWYDPADKIDDDYVTDTTETDTIDLPILYVRGVWVPRVECVKEIEALFAICEAWGIPLAGPRQRTLAESM